MFIRSLTIGAVATVILLTVLVGSRLMDTTLKPEVIELREVNIVEVIPPPDPPEFTPVEEESLETDLVEPVMAIDLAVADTSVNAPKLNLSPSLDQFSTKIETFHLDVVPADLPQRKSPSVRAKPTKRTSSKPSKVIRRSSVSIGELDQKPRELRQGQFRWPSRAKGRSGVVKLLIEIDTQGKVRVVRVVNSTNSVLNSAASRVASGSRFTVPKYKGKPVKTQFTYTYNLKKPR